MKNHTEIELYIINFIQKVTGDTKIDTTLSFMDYSLDSMTIAALAGEITDEFGLVVDPVELYETSSIQSICKQLSQSSPVT